jgi:hypothetical protein
MANVIPDIFKIQRNRNYTVNLFDIFQGQPINIIRKFKKTLQTTPHYDKFEGYFEQGFLYREMVK